MQCETTDFIYPMLADIYYPVVEQGAYGNLKKQWVLDRSITCNFSATGQAASEEVTPNVNISKESILLGRTKTDARISSSNARNSITNILVTNIRTNQQNNIYMETSGSRDGKSTLYEIASNEPVVGPFGNVEYYKIVLRRSENQASDL
jgi:hypothetical protein